METGKMDETGKLLKKLYIAILIALAILLGIFTLFAIQNFTTMTAVRFGAESSAYAIDLARVHSIIFAILCFVLIILLSFSIRMMIRSKQEQGKLFLLYSSLFSTLKTGLMVIDSKKLVRYMNPACQDLLQLEKDKTPYMVSYTTLIKPLLEPIADKLAASFDSGEFFSREYRVFLPSGVMCIRCDFYTFTDLEPTLIHVISLENKTEEADVRQRLSLQLEETHRYAVSKDNFFANMSHEIRTPINAIIGMTYFLKKITTDQKSLEYVTKIEHASDLLLGVVNDILDFSKMQEHKFSLKPENFNLKEIYGVLFDLFKLKAEQKGLSLEIEFDCPDIFYVYGDQFRLTQIFMNIVGNAIKFTEKGEIAVSLTHEILGEDIILRCSVRDTGCGLSEEEISKLFTDFEQFGTVLEKTHEGTGLGLAISKRLVELMHGVIWVESTLGKGSLFHFVVVLKQPELVLNNERPEELPHIIRNSGRILVVEDNEINSEIAEALLAESGYSTDRAVDGMQAIELCRENPTDYYDLILMDIHMPRMNGYDAARVLKKDIRVACPILAVTANSDIISGYILKPYNPGVFKTLLGKDSNNFS